MVLGAMACCCREKPPLPQPLLLGSSGGHLQVAQEGPELHSGDRAGFVVSFALKRLQGPDQGLTRPRSIEVWASRTGEVAGTATGLLGAGTTRRRQTQRLLLRGVFPVDNLAQRSTQHHRWHTLRVGRGQSLKSAQGIGALLSLTLIEARRSDRNHQGERQRKAQNPSVLAHKGLPSQPWFDEPTSERRDQLEPD